VLLHTSYLICTTPRSGSTLLCEALTNTGIAGRPEEFFQIRRETGTTRRPLEYFEGTDTTEIAAILGESTRLDHPLMNPAPGEDYADYLARIMQQRTTPNGVFGAKVMWGYFDGLLSNLARIPVYRDLAEPDLLPTIFPNLHYIQLTRHDKVGQAVSLWKAIQTWAWSYEDASTSANKHPVRQLTFHFGAIDHLVQQIVADEDAWQQYFTDHGIEPFTVVYEELTAAYEETARNILHFLGIPMSENLEFAQRRMKRQADALSTEWVERYYQLKRAHE
jgi:trehalose 2-sulfotransferase